MKRPYVIAASCAAITVMGIASDFFGVVGFMGATKWSLYDFLASNWYYLYLATLGLCSCVLFSYSALERRTRSETIFKLNEQVALLQAALEVRERRLEQLSREATSLKKDLDEHTLTLRETYSKYQDLVERCDSLVIQFSRVVEEFVGTGFFMQYTAVNDSSEAKAIINALMNPIRIKLSNFHELSKRALLETQNALEESERSISMLTELRAQLATAQTERATSVADLMQKRQGLEQSLRSAATEVSDLHAKLQRSEKQRSDLETLVRRQTQQLRDLENATTNDDLKSYFSRRLQQLESALKEAHENLLMSENENKLLSKENVALDLLRRSRRS